MVFALCPTEGENMNNRRTRSHAVELATVLAEQFFKFQTRIQNEKTRVHYRRAVRYLGEFLERPACVSDLTDDNLAGLLQWCLQQRSQSAVTANTSRKCLAALWRWLHNRGIMATGPTIAPLPTPRRTPQAARRDELRLLIQAAKTAPGSICEMPARVWWMIHFALEWDTGARATELLSLRWEWLDWESGWLRVPAEYRKGRAADAVYGLLPDTLDLLGQYRKASGSILQWQRGTHVTKYYKLWNELLERAGLPTDSKHKSQWIRRSFATWVAVGGGDASAACGHSTPSVTRASYLDPTLVSRRHGESLPFRLLGLGEAG